MILNLNDPESILAWWKVLPDQHSAYLDHKLATSVDFAAAIREVKQRIANDPELSSLLVKSVQRRRQSEAQRDGSASHHELRWRELAAA